MIEFYYSGLESVEIQMQKPKPGNTSSFHPRESCHGRYQLDQYYLGWNFRFFYYSDVAERNELE